MSNRPEAVTSTAVREMPELTAADVRELRRRIREEGETVYLIGKDYPFEPGQVYSGTRVDSDGDIVMRDKDGDTFYLNTREEKRSRLALPQQPEDQARAEHRAQLEATAKAMTLDSLVERHAHLTLELATVKAEFDKRTAAIRG